MSRPLRILALGTSAGGGDWPPLVGAALALAEAGHKVSWLADARLADSIGGTGLEILRMPPALDLSSRMQAWDQERTRNPSAAAPFASWVEPVTPLARSHIESWRPDMLLCSDFTALLGLRMKRETGVPVCLVHATFYVGAGARRRLEEDFSPASLGMRGIGAIMQAADLVLVATDPQFDPPPDTPLPHHYWVGTLMWEPIQTTPPWLDEPGPPWALVTLSSKRQADELALGRAAVAALANFPLRVLVTLADPEARDDIPMLGPNVRIETFVPHSAILRRSALCVSHAGHGIVAKALHFGVPMLLVPWDRDQPGVAARAAALGVAAVVARHTLTPNVLADGIRSVLETPAYAIRAREHGERIRRTNAAETVCRRVEEFAAATRPGSFA